MNDSARGHDPGPSSLALFIATGAYCGYSRWAPGTVGTLLGLAVVLIPGVESAPVLSGMILVGLIGGARTAQTVAAAVGDRLTPLASRLKSRFQPRTERHADPSIVVIDEIVGIWIALLLLPKTVVAYAVAFLLFRLFDVLKPQPARALERLPGGWGIMLDDVVAGVYANLGAQGMLWLLPFSS